MTNQVSIARFESQRPHCGPAFGHEDVEIHLRAETCQHLSVKKMQKFEAGLRQYGFAVRTNALARGARNVIVTAPVTDEASFRAFKAQVARLVWSHLGIDCLVPNDSKIIH